MADCMALPLVTNITNGQLHCEQKLRAYEGKSSELMLPGPPSRESYNSIELFKFWLLPKT